MRNNLHRQTHGMKKHPIYATWSNMKDRCLNIKCKDYDYYGGRGIGLCESWMKFENFRDDMFPTWAPGLQLDRVNNDGNYEPFNCRWATRQQNIRNTRRNIKVVVNGKLISALDLATEHGITPNTLRKRIAKGENPISACTRPQRKYTKAIL